MNENADPTNDFKIRTLIRTRKAFLDEKGILRIPSFQKLEKYNLIVLPSTAMPSVIESLHETLSHSSKSAFLAEAKRLFFISGLESAIDNKVKKCPGCLALRTPNKERFLNEVSIKNAKLLFNVLGISNLKDYHLDT